MRPNDRIAEIIEIKQRGLKRVPGLFYEFDRLQRQFEASKGDSDTDDFYIIRSVTLLEVFTRSWVSQLIDYGAPYSERSVDMKTEIKLDLALVKAIHGRVITMGDLIAHNISINSFGQVCSHFKTLLGEELFTLLKDAASSMTVADLIRETGKHKETPPIIANPEKMRRSLVRLFEVRHILCHELPRTEYTNARRYLVFFPAHTSS